VAACPRRNLLLLLPAHSPDLVDVEVLPSRLLDDLDVLRGLLVVLIVQHKGVSGRGALEVLIHHGFVDWIVQDADHLFLDPDSLLSLLGSIFDWSRGPRFLLGFHFLFFLGFLLPLRRSWLDRVWTLSPLLVPDDH
jgi:hypothetical protein